MLKKIPGFINRFIEKNRLAGVIIALVCSCITAVLGLTDAYKRFNMNLYDISFSARPAVQEWDRLYFVDIDDNSTEMLGQFPWPRCLYGKAVSSMSETGVSVPVFDILFPDPSARQVDESEYRDFMDKVERKSEISSDDIQQIIIDNDQIFSQNLKEMGKSVLAYSMSDEELLEDEAEFRKTSAFREAEKYFQEKATLYIDEKDRHLYEKMTDPKTKSVSYPLASFIRSAGNFGFVNRDTDSDGTVRRVRLVQYFDGRLYFNLSLIMLAEYCGVPVQNIEVVPGEKIRMKNAFNVRKGTYGNIDIPVDDQGMMMVNWASGPREKTFKIIPFFALVEYPELVQPVYDLFDSIGGIEGIQKRNEIYEAEVDAGTAFENASSPEEKIRLRKELVSLFEKDRALKDAWMEAFEKEIGEMEQEYSRTGDPVLKEDLAYQQNRLNAMKLVLSVESLRDCIAVTGLTAVGTVDIGSVPTNREYPMVGSYLNTVNTIINEAFIFEVPVWVNLLIIIVLAVITGFAVQRMTAKTTVPFVVIMLAASVAGAEYMFIGRSIWLDMIGISLAVIMPSLVISSVKFVGEEKQKRFIKSAFGHYLDHGVIEQIIANPDILDLGGNEKSITIFFSDVQGFSTISEKLTPSGLVSLLNEYLSEMTDIILKHGGTIDKYEGDAIIAFFGAPVPFEDHALRCCLAAIEQQKRLAELRKVWAEQGRDLLKVRMGMNTGTAVVGNMGSKTRFDYTMMGDSVNLASRLEGANKAYGSCSMISGSTYEEVKNDVEARKLDVIRVVGKKEPVAVYELMDVKGGLDPVRTELVKIWEKGISLYEARQWNEAEAVFMEALKLVPDDGPSLTYADRCRIYAAQPPAPDWDGVFGLTSK